MADTELSIRHYTLNTFADIIRDKKETTDTYSPAEIVTETSKLTTVVDGDVTAAEVLKGKVIYTKAGKIVGTFSLDDELAEQHALIEELEAELAALGG